MVPYIGGGALGGARQRCLISRRQVPRHLLARIWSEMARTLAYKIDVGGSAVERAANTATAAVEHVGVNHGGAHVGMAEQLLHGADVVAAFE